MRQGNTKQVTLTVRVNNDPDLVVTVTGKASTLRVAAMRAIDKAFSSPKFKGLRITRIQCVGDVQTNTPEGQPDPPNLGMREAGYPAQPVVLNTAQIARQSGESLSRDNQFLSDVLFGKGHKS